MILKFQNVSYAFQIPYQHKQRKYWQNNNDFQKKGLSVKRILNTLLVTKKKSFFYTRITHFNKKIYSHKLHVASF